MTDNLKTEKEKRDFHELFKLTGDTGARNLFEKFPSEVCLVEPDTPYDDKDIDTPEDYHAYLESLKGNSSQDL